MSYGDGGNGNGSYGEGGNRVTAAGRGGCGAVPGGGPGGGFQGTYAQLKERQLVFLLVRQLAEAQIARADGPRSAGLWREVAALELDPERITALLYGGWPHDDATLEPLDRTWRERPAAGRRRRPGWGLRLPGGGAWRRGAAPAAPPARR